MANGIKALRKVQIGRESTAGTNVAATVIWRGTGGMPDDQRTLVRPAEDVGYLAGTARLYTPKEQGVATFDDTPATYEQFPHILEASLETVTPTTDTGTGIIYTYDFPQATTQTIKTYSIEAGDNNAAEEMSYAFVSDFSLSGVAGEAWQVGATWMGRTWAPATFTSDLTLEAVEEMLFSKSYLYIDDTTDTIGTSDNIVSETLISATLNVTSGWIPVFTADGNTYFSFSKQTQPDATLALTFEHNATATAEKAKWRALTERQVMIKTVGSALTSGGTYTTKTMIMKFAGTWESFDVLNEQDGNDTVSATFRIGRTTTGSLPYIGQIIIVNQKASL